MEPACTFKLTELIVQHLEEWLTFYILEYNLYDIRNNRSVIGNLLY